MPPEPAARDSQFETSQAPRRAAAFLEQGMEKAILDDLSRIGDLQVACAAASGSGRPVAYPIC